MAVGSRGGDGDGAVWGEVWDDAHEGREVGAQVQDLAGQQGGARGQGQEGKKEHDACPPACGAAESDGAEAVKGPVRLVGRKHKEGVGEGWLRVAQRPRLRGGGEPGPQARGGGRERLRRGSGSAHGYGYNKDSVRRGGGEPGPQARVKGKKRKSEGDGTELEGKKGKKEKTLQC